MTGPEYSKKKFTQHEIRQLITSAKRVIRTSGLDVLLAPTDKDMGRLLMITSRKVGSAVERNLVRRRLKAIYYEQNLSLKKYDCVVIAKKAAVSYSYASLQKLLLAAFALQESSHVQANAQHL